MNVSTSSEQLFPSKEEIFTIHNDCVYRKWKWYWDGLWQIVNNPAWWHKRENFPSYFLVWKSCPVHLGAMVEIHQQQRNKDTVLSSLHIIYSWPKNSSFLEKIDSLLSYIKFKGHLQLIIWKKVITVLRIFHNFSFKLWP